MGAGQHYGAGSQRREQASAKAGGADHQLDSEGSNGVGGPLQSQVTHKA